MGKPKRKYVAIGVSGGWRIWNKKLNKYWGELYEMQPDELLTELNGQNRTEIIVDLTRRIRKVRR